MKYDHTPRPEIEKHYHIQDLIEFHERKTQDRNFHRERIKQNEDRESYITDSKPVALTDFFCSKCKQDFKSVAIRQIEVDWSKTSQRVAFYKSKCDKGHWCIRLITDRGMDAFYSKSKLLAVDRARHSLDTLQPHETGFNLMYGKKL